MRTNGRRRRRSHRGYRRNPGGFLVDLAKRAIPVVFAYYGTRLVVNKLAALIPGVSSLGTLQGPVAAVGGVLLAQQATKRVGFLAKHRNEIMLGSMLNVLDSFIQSFAPASVKALVGMSDYVAVGDYFAVGATPLNDQMTMSDYIAVGGDGVEQELGLEEELGVEEELGSDALLGGLTQGSLLAQVPRQNFLAPVPARSFSRQIPAAGAGYDNPSQLYTGIFNGGLSR